MLLLSRMSYPPHVRHFNASSLHSLQLSPSFMESRENDPTFSKLESACSELKILLRASGNVDSSLGKMDKKIESLQVTLTIASKRIAPLQSLSIATKALDTRINRAIAPALSLLESFKLFESLQRKLLEISSQVFDEESQKKRLKKLIKYVDCVDKLNDSISSISHESEPAIQKLQEVVEFLSRTKATDQYRTHRLSETLITLKALYETEIDAMRFDGLLDEALLNLQDEFERILQQLKHQNIVAEEQGAEGGDAAELVVASDLGNELEIEVLRRISETLAANDCLDICIDLFVKVRYRRAAKALMRLNPDYLRTYRPEEIDEMEWENLETAITLWIQHFEVAVKTVFVSEKKLCSQVLGNVRAAEGEIWPECFVKIADKIMAVFFRFGEGVARSSKEAQKLFKLLDMFESLEKLKPEFYEIFEGEAGADICSRFRELEKLLVHASTKVFWEFGLQIEGNQDGLPPPRDGSVPKVVRYAINYLKYLATQDYSSTMANILRTEQIWKSGIFSNPETDEGLLRDAITSVMEALQRNIEFKKSMYSDKVLAHVFYMNTYWYIYMRSRNSEIGKLLGEQYLKKMYKSVAEESAYLYQKQTWGDLVKLLETEETTKKIASNKDGGGNEAPARGKMEAFLKGFEEISRWHIRSYCIPAVDLRGQIREAIVKLLVTAYAEFLDAYSSVLEAQLYPSPESIKEQIDQIFDGGDPVGDVKSILRRRDLTEGGNPGVVERLRRFKSNASDA